MTPASPHSLRTENVVAAARLGGPFDITRLSKRLRGAEYHPQRFAGLVVHVPGGSALIFEDGKVVTTGARAVEEALAQMEHVRELLGQAEAEVDHVDQFTVKNLVVSLDLETHIPLDQTALAFPDEDITYDAAQFPGLILRLHDPMLSLLVFQSGKIVATGSGDMPAIEEAVQDFVEALEERSLVVG